MPNPNQVRIVVIDYYMSSPIPGLDLTYSEFRSSAITHVPVLRCFGSDKNGKKTCVHIHGVFPYLYIPYNGKGNSEEHMYKIAMALDKAINISFNQASSNAQHVYKICLVSGIPMYGYHLNQHQFFKIFLYNPALIAKVGDILLRRTALDEIYQPHEAHLNFTLQFMIDYNLHGMSSMLISDIKYRTNPDEKYSDLDETLRRPNIIKRTSICELEGDINAEHILNRQETVGVNPGIAALWDDEKLRRRNKGENSQLGNFLELQDIDTDSTKTHLIFQQSLRERLAVLVTNEDIQKQSLDVSIYPAEIPRHTKSNFQNASQIDIHSTSSLELSLDETFSVTCSQGLYDTITPNESQFDVSLDEEAQEFLNMLQHMANDKGAQNGVEEDEECILSQVEAEDVNDDSNEHFLDLSMPLESLATPTKSTNENILQLDGFVDDWLSDSDNESLATLRKKWHCEQPSSQLTENVTSVRLKCSKSMPLLESTCQVHKNQNNLFKHKEVQPDKLKLNVVVLLERIQVEKIANIEPLDLIKTLNKNVAAVKYPYFNKRSPEDIFEDNMRLIKFRMERLISRRKLKVIGDKLRIKYKKAVKLSKKISLSPKFNLVSAKRRWLGVPTKRSRGESNNYSASEIVIQRTSSTPNMYFNCDGLVDSTSSDDEQGLGSKEKKSVKQPLDIIVKNSPRILENFQRGVAKNLPKADESDKYFQQTSAEETVILCTPSRAPDKRKHSFESKPLINKTISEYMQPTSVSNATTTSNEFMESSKEENLNLEVIRGQRKKTRNELVSKMEISNNYSSTVEAAHISEPVPYDLHIFCNDEKLNRSFFKSYLSVSEKYDIMQGYRTKQGCSTLLTQSSFSNSTVVKRCQDNKIIFNNSRLAKLSNQEKNFSIMNRVEFTTFKPASKAPTKAKVKSTLLKYGIPKIRPEEPFYNNVEDEKGAIEMGHRTLRISSKTTAHLAEFQSKYDGFNKYRKKIMEIISKLPWNSNNVSTLKISHCEDRRIIIRPLKKTPRIVSVKSWLVENVNKSENSVTEGHDYEANVTLSLTYCPPQFEISGSSLLLSQNSTSSVLEPSRTNSLEMLKLRDSIISSGEEHNSYEITGISQKLNKSVQNLQVARATTEHQYLTTMVMELHIRTRGDFKPDPQYDPICAIFYSILNDSPDSKSNINGVIAIDNLPEDQGSTKSNFFSGLDNNCAITFVDAEISLFQSLVNLVKHWDPDIITGYEIEMLSWGYLIERAYVLSFDIIPMLGRSQLHRYGKMKFNRKLVDSLETSIIGRILLNVWRIMRQEIALQSYTFESIAYHILNRRISMFCFKQLTYFWDHRTNHYRHRVVNYYLLRVDTVLELFNKLDFLNRTSELAKLFGILFYEVLSRGSQFRVESMMLRLAKPLNYVPVSPSTEQRSKMKAPEYIPLVMEPESKLYTDPVIVLDFQSLYPSIIIAYNYCFTTCIGRVKYLGTNHPFEFGASQLKVPRKVVEKLCKRDLLNFSPCGVAFVKRKVREGILPRMLKEVLETRFMVKNAMKENKGNENLLKVLHNRQLGLKLIANVTYGYTAANFSGRMCCVEVGDSVVSKGRETLEHAIAVVEENAEWEAKVRLVVYGDTDSLFVLTPGKSKEEAFEIGRKIANAITKVNPDPVKLKLEKVYQPCILQTKKRYVGFMYESADQNEPVYEAKGIETVRRDGCPAVTKMLQKCLTLLFKTKDISLIKSYVLKQFNKIQAGRVSIQDLTFAKEYRGFTNYKPEACVPALELTRKWLAIDRRNEPRRGERVPYIVVNGPPSLPLIKLVRSPRELLNDNSLRPNVLYYISKVIIPPINRCLNLIGVDLNNWFHEMPRKTTLHLPNYSPTLVKSTISQYFISKICACCATPAQEGLCANCLKNPHISVLRLSEKLKKWEQNYHDTLLICQTCSCSLDEVVCNSLDCPVLYRRYQTISDHQQSSYVRELLNKLGAFSYDQWF
ncbi:DNA polymerase zeta catalytic subunit isoform X6 [Anthonomus grandis grandis]|uniref:DNA polymerase zeta catalytic subunit isoform X6 n=1 Tax=Anthonomus grandis grandis TaxID=2921223 RepID=UPI002166C0EE|nr:DNA polymerase zeta catalytic subunit isoform X6 [Anthonomus grandis grandis]